MEKKNYSNIDILFEKKLKTICYVFFKKKLLEIIYFDKKIIKKTTTKKIILLQGINKGINKLIVK